MQSNDAPLVFDDLSRREEPVRIAGKEYVLREGTEADVAKWTNSHTAAAKIVDGKLAGIGNVADNRKLLVHLCLFEPISDGQGNQTGERNVPLPVIAAWPHRVVDPIFERAKKLCGVGEDRALTREELRAKIAELQEQLAKVEGTDSDSVAEADAKN